MTIEESVENRILPFFLPSFDGHYYGIGDSRPVITDMTEEKGENGAGEEIRTLDLFLGKEAL